MSALSSVLAKDPVSLFVPGASIEERKLRQRLHNASTIASMKAVNASSEHARSLFWMVNEVAFAWKFAPATAEDLKDIADALVRLFLVAGELQRLEGGGQ